MTQQTNKKIQWITLLTYLVMVTTNALANIIPINGKGTGEISDSYKNLFAPAGITFSIWGVIYVLLLAFTIYQLTYVRSKGEAHKKLVRKTSLIFSVSSVANSIWILAWHYDYILVSLVMMCVILLSLIMINLILRKKKFNRVEHMLIRLPFTVYLGWITVATIANITTYLVSIGWNRLGFTEVFWTMVIILVGAIIGAMATIFYKSTSYGLVILWAYAGIGIKHLGSNGFDGEYINIIITVGVSVVILILSEMVVIRNKMKEKILRDVGEIDEQ